MSGALAERVFVEKMTRAGFVDVEVVERRPVAVGDCVASPLFSEDLVDLMRRLIPPERQDRIATAIVVVARRGAREPAGSA